MLGKNLTADGPNEVGAWSSALIRASAELGDRLLIGLESLPESTTDLEISAALAGVILRGGKVRKIVDRVEQPPYALLGCNRDGRRLAGRWNSGFPSFDSLLHAEPFSHNRNSKRLTEVEKQLARWIEKNTVAVPIGDILPTGYKTIHIKQGDRIDFQAIFGEACRPGCTEIVFQDPFSSLNPRMKVWEIIAEPLIIHNMAKGRCF